MITCPFCSNIEPKSRIIEEKENSLVILSNPALVRGHLLVIPKRHIEKLSELNEVERKELISQVIKFQEVLLKKFYGCDIRQNYRPFQKQDGIKVNHLHIHLQPREFEDELFHKSQIFEKSIFRNLSQDELNEIREQILK